MPRMSKDTLKGLLAAEKADALSAADAAKLSEDRERAMLYYNGDMSQDMPTVTDRSKAVSYDVSDTVEGLMPSLMEIFAGGDEVVKFAAINAEDEDQAEQETAYINHVFMQKNPGFLVTYSLIKDALLQKNGVAKVFWHESEDEERETYYDQPDDVYALFLADDEIEIVEHTEYPPPVATLPQLPAGTGGMPAIPPPGMTGGPPPMDAGGMMPAGPMPGAPPDAGPPPATTTGAPAPGPAGPPGPPGPADMVPPGPPPGPPGAPPAGMNGAGGPPVPPQPGGPPAPAPAPVLAPGPYPPYGTTHDFTTVRKRKYGCCRIEAVPPEEFGVSRTAKLGEKLNYSYHEVVKTQAELIDSGFDADQINDLPSASFHTSAEAIARDTVNEHADGSKSDVNKSNRLVRITEHYCLLDYEGNDKPAMYRVTTGGDGDSDILRRNGKLDIEQVPFDPFVTITPFIVTHRYFGKSVADLVIDIQRIKTSMIRGICDNVYLANNQRLEVAEAFAHPKTLDDILDNRIGGVVRTKQPGGLLPIPNAPIGDFVFPVIEYFDQVREWRSGVTRHGQGLNSEALQDIGDDARAQVQDAAMEKTRLIARIFAETGFKDLFWKIHATVRRNESSRPTAKLRGKWVTVDPREWRQRDDLTATVGLGGGSKAAQIAFWGNEISSMQETLNMVPGLTTPTKIFNALKRRMEIAGYKDVERYWSDPAQAPPPPPQPDPVQQKLQAQQQIAQQKVQSDQMIAQQKAQSDAQLEQSRAQADQAVAAQGLQTERAKLAAQMELEQHKLQVQHDLKMQQMQAEFALKHMQIEQDAQLQREAMIVGAHTKIATAPVRFGGQPG